MKNKFEVFSALHKENKFLLIGNVWNVQSARVYEQKKFKGIATSSAAVAETLGYADGQGMSFAEYLFVIKRIALSVSIPFSVDMEAGYGNSPTDICNNIIMLHELGVCGINIEDSVITNGKRSIANAKAFSEQLRQIVQLLNAGNVKMFINVRSDSFLLGLPNPLEDALARVKLYQDTGVHGLFFPCITNIADIRTIAENSRLPVNVMCMPDLPDFNQLNEAGIKRLSVGPFLNKKIYQQMESAVSKMDADGDFSSLF